MKRSVIMKERRKSQPQKSPASKMNDSMPEAKATTQSPTTKAGSSGGASKKVPLVQSYFERAGSASKSVGSATTAASATTPSAVSTVGSTAMNAATTMAGASGAPTEKAPFLQSFFERKNKASPKPPAS